MWVLWDTYCDCRWLSFILDLWTPKVLFVLVTKLSAVTELCLKDVLSGFTKFGRTRKRILLWLHYIVGKVTKNKTLFLCLKKQTKINRTNIKRELSIKTLSNSCNKTAVKTVNLCSKFNIFIYVYLYSLYNLINLFPFTRAYLFYILLTSIWCHCKPLNCLSVFLSVLCCCGLFIWDIFIMCLFQ